MVLCLPDFTDLPRWRKDKVTMFLREHNVAYVMLDDELYVKATKLKRKVVSHKKKS